MRTQAQAAQQKLERQELEQRRCAAADRQLPCAMSAFLQCTPSAAWAACWLGMHRPLLAHPHGWISPRGRRQAPPAGGRRRSAGASRRQRPTRSLTGWPPRRPRWSGRATTRGAICPRTPCIAWPATAPSRARGPWTATSGGRPCHGGRPAVWQHASRLCRCSSPAVSIAQGVLDRSLCQSLAGQQPRWPKS